MANVQGLAVVQNKRRKPSAAKENLEEVQEEKPADMIRKSVGKKNSRRAKK